MERMVLRDDGIELLTEAECRRLLARERVGRVVVVTGGLGVVFPVNYGMIGGDIAFFTGEGTKLTAAGQGAMVTFEVDAIDLDDESGWSVLAVGTATLADAGLRARAEAIGVYPWAGGDRHRLVRIRPDVITGRRIATGRRDEADPAPSPLPTF